MNIIPENWKVEDLEKYSNEISVGAYLISASGCTTPANASVFTLLKNWREPNDYLDIIYSYYLYVAKDGQSYITSNLWMKFPLPGVLQNWFTAFYNAAYLAQFMAYNATGQGTAYLLDTSDFMYYYFLTYELAEDVKACGNQMYIDLYNLLEGDVMADNNLKFPNGGYIYQSSGMIASEQYTKLWASYLEIIKLNASGSLSAETHAELFENTFAALADLTPIDVYGFISSLHFLYTQSGGNYYAFDFSTGAHNKFVYYLANYYTAKLPEASRNAFQQLLLAIESYSHACAFTENTSAITAFNKAIESLNTIYKGLNQAEQTAFDALIGDCYAKYLGIYNTLKATASPTLGEWQTKLDSLTSTLDSFYGVLSVLNNANVSTEDKMKNVILLFALYEKANVIYTELLNSENSDVINTLFTDTYKIGDNTVTIDTAFFSIRNMFIYYMVNLSLKITGENGKTYQYPVWELYCDTELPAFLATAASVMEAYTNKGMVDSEVLLAAMNGLHKLSDYDKQLFYKLGINLYYDAIQSFLYGAISAQDITEAEEKSLQSLVTSVLKAEIAALTYSFDTSNSEARENFIKQMEEAIALYSQITSTELRDDLIGEIYNYYLALYNSIKGTAQ